MEGGDGEIITYIKVWMSAFACVVYCYFISFNIPKGKFRFFSLLPVFYFFTILPINLTTVCLGATTAWFLTWLANFKLLLFSFGQGPLSSDPSISLPHFLSIACFPVKIKNTKSQALPSPKFSLKTAIKASLYVLLSLAYQHITPKLMLAYYCSYMYLGLEFALAIAATLAKSILGHELEPQFNDPYLSTSLQDFWGRRWNLIVSNILRPTVYQPIKLISMKMLGLGKEWSTLLAVLITFVVSGLMHELVYFYIARVRPTWEVTLFFVLHGFLVVLEIVVKKVAKGRWRLHLVVSAAFTVGILIVTSYWLFFPQLIRCKADVRISIELTSMVNYFKNLGKSVGNYF